MFAEGIFEKKGGRWYYSVVVNGKLLVGSRSQLDEVFDELEEAVTIDI